MWRALLAAAVLAISGCTQIPKTPQEIADQKMEPVPGKAVIYIVQNAFGIYDAGLTMDDGTQINTWPGTFYRWVTTPGTHKIHSSEGNLSARITLHVEAGKIYFVQHWVNGVRGSTTDASLQLIGPKLGGELVTQGRLCCATK
jgi:hypothetical protein